MTATLHLGAGWDIVPSRAVVYARRRDETNRFPRRLTTGVDLIGILKSAASGLIHSVEEESWVEQLLATGVLDNNPLVSVGSRSRRELSQRIHGVSMIAPESGEYFQLLRPVYLPNAQGPVLGALRSRNRVFFAWATRKATLEAIYDLVAAECEFCNTYADVVIGRACVNTRNKWKGPTAFWCADELNGLEEAFQVAAADLDRVFVWSPDDGLSPYIPKLRRFSFLVTDVSVEQAAPKVWCASAMYCTPDLRVSEEVWSPWATSAATTSRRSQLICSMEAIERYAALAFMPSAGELLQCCWRDLGRSALDPNDLNRQSEADAQTLRSGKTLWCRGIWVGSGEEVWLPLQVVTLRKIANSSLLPMHPPSTAGVAAHTQHRKALKNALLELCEREALMIAWSNRLELPRIVPDTLADNDRELTERLQNAGYEVFICDATMDLVAVALVFAFDRTGSGRILLKGSAANEDPAMAVHGALLEAHACLYFNSDQGFGIPQSRHVRTGKDHLTFNSRGDRIAYLRSWIESGPLREVEAMVRNDLWQTLEKADLRPVYCDLTPRFFFTGVSIVRVIVPGMVPLVYGYIAKPHVYRRQVEVPKMLEKRSVAGQYKFGQVPVHPFG